MKPDPFSIIRRNSIFLFAGVLISSFIPVMVNIQPVSAATMDTVCRFGITSIHGSEGYDIASIGVGSYLDWGVITNPSLPEGVEYIRILRLRDDLYSQTLANLPEWVQNNSGSVWIIGNEPDTTYEYQDALLPEVYADRYYEIARIIRRIDKTAHIGFGSVVQPTPIRMRYLDRAWNRLVADAGSLAAASRLIDIWSIHSFILNEQPGSWGTGIPPGFENDHYDAVVIINFSDTHSIEIFKERLVTFRSWMASKGEREKPVWIVEYGSLFPPIDPPGGPDYVNVSDDATAAYMVDTFEFLLNASDDQTGLPADGNHLVQRWFWFSLNDHRYHFGGTIFDPDNGKLPTMVGEALIDFQAANLAQPDLYPLNLSVGAASYSHDRTLVNYRVDVTVGNNLFADASCAQVWIYDGDPDADGILIAGPIPASAIKSDYGNGKTTLYWREVQPLTYHTLYVRVEPIGVADANTDNNLAAFSVYLELPKLSYLTTIYR